MAGLGEVVLRVEGLHKYFGRLHVLRGVDLAVRERETVVVIGRSGSGKTTLLKCINFLEEPAAGTVEIAGTRVEADPTRARAREHQEEIRRVRVRTGMVFQEFNLFPHMTALGNCIEGPMKVKGMARAEAIGTAESFLAKVGMSDKRDEYPNQLSGGQKQRVAIARALSMQPAVLLFDEPTSALDPELVGEVIAVMEQLAHEGTTMIVVTHEMEFAREAADRVLFMEEGFVVEDGPTDEVLDTPRDERTRQFLRRFLARDRDSGADDTAAVPTAP